MESRFHEISRSKYIVEIQADDDVVSVNVPQNVTRDVAGNKNLASNVLQVRHCKDLAFSLFACCPFIFSTMPRFSRSALFLGLWLFADI